MDYSPTCPLCRTVIHVDPVTAPQCVILQSFIEKTLPQRFVERREAAERQKLEQKSLLPLFVLSTSGFPGQVIPMHIFEPRYRLMMRRVLQGSRCFGLVACGPDRVPRDTGVVLHITHSELLPDGRSIIITQATKRFHIRESWELDGYLMGKVEYFEDEPLTEEQARSCRALYHKLEHKHLQYLTRTNAATRDIEEVMKRKPCLSEDQICRGAAPLLQHYSFWMASSLPAAMQGDLQVFLLKLRSTHERLEALDRMITQDLRSEAEREVQSEMTAASA